MPTSSAISGSVTVVPDVTGDDTDVVLGIGIKWFDIAV